MFVTSFCMQCQAESGVPNFASTKAAVVPDDCVIEHICDRGHQTFTVINNPRYELLAEYAVVAMADGYYREAVASFASAYERLLEDFVRLSCRVRSISTDQFDAAWKPMGRLSERQMGAFSLCWLIEAGESFKHLPAKTVELRNAVIHRGKIPHRSEAIGYGQAVIDHSRPIIEKLHSDAYEQSRVELLLERAKARRASYKGHYLASMAMSSPLGFDPAIQHFDLSAHLAKRESGPNVREMADLISSSAVDFGTSIGKAVVGTGKDEG